MSRAEIFCLAIAAPFMMTSMAWASTIEVGTDDNWCSIANDADPGTTLELAPGDHMDTCHLRATGEEDAPIIIRSADPDDPARLAYSGTGANTIEVRSESRFVEIRDLHFPGTAGPHAIRFHSPTDITVAGNHFEQTGGVTMSANFSDSEPTRLHILDNSIFDVDTTAIYFGCHSGADDCRTVDAHIEGNTFYGLSSPGVGYAIQIKVDSNAVIRDNAIFDIQGPGVMVYGAHDDGTATSIIDGNLIVGSRDSGAILAGGGPAIITNNIVADGATHGIHLYEHNVGAPQRDMVVAHNTVFDNQGTAIMASGWSDDSNVLANNAIAPNGHSAIGGSPSGTVEGNIVCEDDGSDCFQAPNGDPFSLTPLIDGPLYEAVEALDDADSLTEDFMGHERSATTHAGALAHISDDGGPWFEIGQDRPPRVDDPSNGDDDDEDDSNGDEEPSNGHGDDDDDGDDSNGDEEPSNGEQEHSHDDDDDSNGGSCSATDNSTSLVLLVLAMMGLVALRRRATP